MGNITIELQKAHGRGDVKSTNGFGGEVRDVNAGFQLGDIFTIPANYEVYKTKVNGNQAEYTFAEMYDEAGNRIADQVKRFFPGIMSRTVDTVNQDLTPVPNGRVTTDGQPAKDFKACAMVNDGVKAIAGKLIKITAANRVLTKRYGMADTQYQTVFSFEYYTPAAQA